MSFQSRRYTLAWPHSILVIGCGLIGTSFAMAVKAVLADTVTIDAVEVQADHRETVAGTGLFRQVSATMPNQGDYDLVVLAVPVDTACNLLEPCSHLGSHIMDVCSVKTDICVAASRLQLQGRFFPTHPMAGLASEGPAKATADLFRERPWLGIASWPLPKSLTELIEALGAQWHSLPTPEVHDSLMAVVSHSVHLASLSVMLSYHRVYEESGIDAAGFCGPAFQDITRLAASPAGFWTSTLLANRENTAEHLRKIVKELQGFADLLETGDEQALRTQLDAARQARMSWETSPRHLS